MSIKNTLLKLWTNDGKIPVTHTPLWIFTISWINYFSLYFLRKSQTTTKSLFLEEFYPGDYEQQKIIGGWFDNAYLLPYAAGQVLWPNLVDYLGSRKAWFFCLFPASISLVLVKFVSYSWQLALCLIGTALAQSLCWPSMVKQLSNFMTDVQYKSLLPLAGSSVFVGNLVGNLISAGIVNSGQVDKECMENFYKNKTLPFPNQDQFDSLWMRRTDEDPFVTVKDFKKVYADNYEDISKSILECRENNWRKVFWLPALVPTLISILTFLCVPDDSPKNYGNLVTSKKTEVILEQKKLLTVSAPTSDRETATPSPNLDSNLPLDNSAECSNENSQKVYSMWEIATIGWGIWFLALGYFCVKGSRYWMYYNAIPMMKTLTDSYWDEADGAVLLTGADIGGTISTFILPFLLMKYEINNRKYYLRTMIIAVIVCALSVPVLLLVIFTFVPAKNKTMTYIAWTTFGFLAGIPDNLYSGISVNELSNYLVGNVQASLAGFVNGLGGFGPIVGSPLTGLIDANFGVQKGGLVAVGFCLVAIFASLMGDKYLVGKRREWKFEQQSKTCKLTDKQIVVNCQKVDIQNVANSETI